MSDPGPASPGDITEDAFLGGRLVLRQPQAGYRAGVDAVLLAAAAPLPPGAAGRVLDAGAGVGTVGLCLAARCPAAQVVLVERDPRLAQLARDNVERNGLAARAKVVCADITAPAGSLSQYGLVPAAFDHLLANPPFHREDAGTPARNALKSGAHAMPAGSLEQWARFLAHSAAPGATVTLIHKSEALPDVLAALQNRFGALHVLPIAPREHTPAIRILVQGIKGSRAPLVLLHPLVLHDANGAFTEPVAAILRAGAPLSLAGKSGRQV